MAKDFGQKAGTGSQTIQTSRGNIIKRNDSKVLARGELFIQTTDVLGPELVVTSKNVVVDSSSSPHIYDMGTKSYIHSFFQGDLFAGTGEYGKVWSLGSGGALKWGGVSGATSWDALKAASKLKPNHIFMYIGNRPITAAPTPGQSASDSSIAKITDTEVRDRAPGTRGNAPVDVEAKYVGYDPEESTEVINPGDLFFYSPVYDENVVIHLSHSSDALTKINQFALVSESMKKWFADLLGTENTRFATLKDFLDGPVRRYQSLIGEEGWNPITVTPVVEQTTDDKSDHIIGCNTITPADFASTDFDGAIHYIPFENGRKRIPFNDSTDRYTTGVNRLHEGDLILSIPTDNGGVEYSVISLYGKLLDQLSARNLNFNRADPYADSIWDTPAATTDYGTDTEFKANLENTITEYIKRLYLTKVDLDPTTKKIISSQLPDFLLGAPKFMRVLKAEDTAILSSILNPGDEDPDNPANIPANAHDIAKVWTTGFANIDDNIDDETTDNAEPHRITEEGKYDTKLQAGSYWVWNGGHFVIDGLGDYFNLDKKDDYDPTGNENKGEFVHALENGDWIVYNGENQKFDILDNSSSFVGIMMDGVKLSGTPEFTDVQRIINETDWDGNAITANPHEVKLTPKSTTELEFSNPNSVIFKEDGTGQDAAFVDEDHVPVISNKGTAKNSRWQLTDKQAGVSLPATQSDDASPQLSSIKFLFSKYINEAVAPYATTLAGSDELNIGFWEANNTDNKYVLHGFGLKPNGENTTTSNTVLDLQEFNFTSEAEVVNGVGKYKFEILGEENPVLELPTHSGILATERYVDSGFVVVKKVIEDLYEEIMKQTTSGHIDWLQTLVPAATLNGKKLYDSRVQQILTRSEDTGVADPSAVDNLGFGFYLVKSFDDNGDIKFNSSLYTKLIVKKVLTDLDGPINLTLEANGQSHTYNPSELETGKPVENVLPNHGGTLLNNNSVIDGGEFI